MRRPAARGGRRVLLGLGMSVASVLIAGCSGVLGSSTDVGMAGAAGSGGDVSPRRVMEVGLGGSTGGPTEKAEQKAGGEAGKGEKGGKADPDPEKGTEPGSGSGGEKEAPKEPEPRGGGEEQEPVEVTVTLPPLKQPTEPYPKPKKPEPPADSADEYLHVVYAMQQRTWDAAGSADGETETECEGLSVDVLSAVGVYQGSCQVTASGVTVKYRVDVEITSEKIILNHVTDYLPLTEEKAVYEATRQSFQPARVTCDIVGVELVRVADENGFTCWVTDVENVNRSYRGTLLRTGEVVLVEKE